MSSAPKLVEKAAGVNASASRNKASAESALAVMRHAF